MASDNSEEPEMETPEAPLNSDRYSIARTMTQRSGVPAVSRMATLRFPLQQTQIEQVVNDALNEDGAYDDITTIATIVSDRRLRGALVARQDGVVPACRSRSKRFAC